MPKPRILQIVGSLNVGGIEMWLLSVVKDVNTSVFQMDFFVQTTQKAYLDDQFVFFGAKIFGSSGKKNKVKYLVELYKCIRDNGPYSIIHSHVGLSSGWVLLIAWLAGVKTRIAHSHNDRSSTDKNAPLTKKIYFLFSRFLINVTATDILAASPIALKWLTGNMQVNNHKKVLPCGIDLSPFYKVKEDKYGLRMSLGIPADGLVLGHIGRFSEQKNHSFIIDIFAELLKLQENWYLILVGDGPLRNNVIEQARMLGCYDKCRFVGIRNDVPNLLMNLFSFFIFPSKHEGLGLVLVEAQAAGLSSIAADTVPQDAVIVPDLVKFLSLEEGAKAWAMEIITMYTRGKDFQNFGFAMDKVASSCYNSVNSAKKLLQLYSSKISDLIPTE